METAIQGSGVEPSDKRINALSRLPLVPVWAAALLVGCAGLALILIGCGLWAVGQRAANLYRRLRRIPECPEFDPEADHRKLMRMANR
jgi:hypothetical protein